MLPLLKAHPRHSKAVNTERTQQLPGELCPVKGQGGEGSRSKHRSLRACHGSQHQIHWKVRKRCRFLGPTPYPLALKLKEQEYPRQGGQAMPGLGTLPLI